MLHPTNARPGTPARSPAPSTRAPSEERWHPTPSLFDPEGSPFVLLKRLTVVRCSACQDQIAVVRDRKAASLLGESHCSACV